MAKENSKELYPEAVIAWLDFTAQLIGKKFNRGDLNKINFTDASLSGDKVCSKLITDNDLLDKNDYNIVKLLFHIIAIHNSYHTFYIPIGIDKD
jgi:hypothetical protein